MRKLIITMLLTLIILLAAAGLLSAWEDGWGPGSEYNSKFDPCTVETLSGELLNMDLFVPQGMSVGVRIILKTAGETIPVHLGPLSFMKKQKREIAPGDKIEVTGSRVDCEGKPVIIASEIRKGGKRLKLRDENGVPVWCGGKTAQKNSLNHNRPDAGFMAAAPASLVSGPPAGNFQFLWKLP